MRKNILIIGHNYATQFIDINNQYARLFDEKYYEVTVAYLTGEPSDIVRKRTLAENVIFLNMPKKHIRALKIVAVKKLLKFCREKQFHLVICHRYKPSYIMMWVSQFCKIPALIFVMHELKTMASLSRQLLITCLSRKNMLFAGVSKAVCDDMKKDLWGLPKKQISTIFNMIDVDLTQPAFLSREEARRTLNLDPDDFIFGNLARLCKNKDHRCLIKAFARVKPYCKQAKLIIVGDGELDTKLKEFVISLKLTQDVIFTGFLPDGFRYMKAFDCFVLSSKQEAFGRVLLEAMIAKLPIIATKVHGIPEVLGDIGLLTQPKDPAALANMMKRVYIASDEERQLLGEKGFVRATTQFSIPKFHEQFWQLPLIQKLNTGI